MKLKHRITGTILAIVFATTSALPAAGIPNLKSPPKNVSAPRVPAAVAVPRIPVVPKVNIPAAPKVPVVKVPTVKVPAAPRIPVVRTPSVPKVPALKVPVTPKIPVVKAPAAPKLPATPRIVAAPKVPVLKVPATPKATAGKVPVSVKAPAATRIAVIQSKPASKPSSIPASGKAIAKGSDNTLAAITSAPLPSTRAVVQGGSKLGGGSNASDFDGAKKAGSTVTIAKTKGDENNQSGSRTLPRLEPKKSDSNSQNSNEQQDSGQASNAPRMNADSQLAELFSNSGIKTELAESLADSLSGGDTEDVAGAKVVLGAIGDLQLVGADPQLIEEVAGRLIKGDLSDNGPGTAADQIVGEAVIETFLGEQNPKKIPNAGEVAKAIIGAAAELQHAGVDENSGNGRFLLEFIRDRGLKGKEAKEATKNFLAPVVADAVKFGNDNGGGTEPPVSSAPKPGELGNGPNSGPTSGPTSGPASGPASGPTSEPTSGPNSGTTPASPGTTGQAPTSPAPGPSADGGTPATAPAATAPAATDGARAADEYVITGTIVGGDHAGETADVYQSAETGGYYAVTADGTVVPIVGATDSQGNRAEGSIPAAGTGGETTVSGERGSESGDGASGGNSGNGGQGNGGNGSGGGGSDSDSDDDDDNNSTDSTTTGTTDTTKKTEAAETTEANDDTAEASEEGTPNPEARERGSRSGRMAEATQGRVGGEEQRNQKKGLDQRKNGNGAAGPNAKDNGGSGVLLTAQEQKLFAKNLGMKSGGGVTTPSERDRSFAVTERDMKDIAARRGSTINPAGGGEGNSGSGLAFGKKGFAPATGGAPAPAPKGAQSSDIEGGQGGNDGSSPRTGSGSGTGGATGSIFGGPVGPGISPVRAGAAAASSVRGASVRVNAARVNNVQR